MKRQVLVGSVLIGATIVALGLGVWSLHWLQRLTMVTIRLVQW